MSERVGLEGVLDLSQFTGNLNVYVQGVEKMKSETVNASASITKAGGGINVFQEIAVGALRRVGEAAVEWMGRAAGAVRDFVDQSFQGAIEDEQILTRLNQTIKSTGGIAGVSSSDALALADSFHILAGGSDDAVLALIQVGLQLGTISEEEMPAFIQTSLDLGAVMGSATEAARLLAFAEEQPTQALRRFRMANILFTDSETAAIKSMEEAGNTAGAFAVIMDKVSLATSGAAQANLDTLGGKLGLFKTVVAESGEAILGAFLPAAHALFDATLAPAIPIIESLSSAFASLVTQIISGDAAAGFDTFRESVRTSLGETAANAVTWGSNIVINLAQGIIDGIGYVIDALSSVANVISYWLSPGSPPNLLPDLPEWGAAAMGEWINGFTSADFGAFKDLSGQFEAVIRQMGEDIVPKTGLVPLILGGRDAIAEAIAQVKMVGAVTDDIIASVTAAFGPAGGALTNYTRALLESEVANKAVSDAQAALNSVVAEYDALLSEVDDQISGIDNAQKDLQDEQRKTFLNAILLDPNASASKKANARLELEKIAAEKRKRMLVDEKKGAVDNAQIALDSAKDKQTLANAELARQKALLSIQMEQNKLLKEQADLLEKMAAGGGGGGGGGAAKPAGGGGKGVPKPGGLTMPGGGINDLKESLLGGLDSLLAPLQEKLTGLQTAFSTAWDAITATLAPASVAWNNLMLSVGGALARLGAAFASTAPTAQAALGLLAATVVEVLGINLPTILDNLSATVTSVLDGIAEFWRQWGDEIIMAVTFAFQAVIAGVGGALTIVSAIIRVAVNTVLAFWKAFTQLLQGDWEGALHTVIELAQTNFGIIVTAIQTFFNSALSIVGTNLTEFLDSWRGTFELLKTLVLETFTNVAESIETGINNAIAGARALLGDFIQLGTDFIDGIIEGIVTGATSLANAARDAIQGAIDSALGALGNPHSPSPVTRKLIGRTAGQGMTAGLLDEIRNIRSASLTAATALLAPASQMVNNNSNTSSTTYNLSEHYNSGPKDSVRSFMSMKARARG